MPENIAFDSIEQVIQCAVNWVEEYGAIDPAVAEQEARALLLERDNDIRRAAYDEVET